MDNITPINRSTKVKRHLTTHKGKYTVSGALVTAAMVLHVMGALGPLFCALPFVKDEAKCLAGSEKAAKAGDALIVLDAKDGGLQ